VATSQGDAHLSYRVEYDLGRVRAFSDCVFAVAITIVVFTFALPDRGVGDDALASDLLAEWPRYLSYLAAFAVIGYTWMIHHQLFEVIRRVDVTAIWINLALLSFVVLTPYPMQLLGRQPTLSAPYVLFNLNALIFGVLNFLLVLYATHRRRLIAEHMPSLGVTILRRRAEVFPIALAVATLLAVPFGAWGIVAWGLIPIGRWLVHRRWGSLSELQVEADQADDSALEDETMLRADQLERESQQRGRPLAPATVFAESGSLTRLIGFSDNVYAFAITLLVLQLNLPARKVATNSELWSYVAEQLQPNLTGYFVGFAIIGLFWTIHHRDFLLIERQDAWLRALNLLHLMFIAVMPFATLVLSSFDRFRSATVVYALCAGMASASLVVVFLYATQHHRLVDPAIPWSDLRERRATALIAPGGFLLSIPVALVSPTLAQLLWLVPFVGTRAFRIRRQRQESATTRHDQSSPFPSG
jgi:uncharacterized membrane protein